MNRPTRTKMGRGALRRPLRIGLRIVGGRGSATATARDISEEGIQILSPKSYAEGSEVEILLHRPGRASDAVLKAEVRWVEPVKAPAIYLLGCHFVHTDETRARLRDLLGDVARRPDRAPQPRPARHLRPK